MLAPGVEKNKTTTSVARRTMRRDEPRPSESVQLRRPRFDEFRRLDEHRLGEKSPEFHRQGAGDWRRIFFFHGDWEAASGTIVAEDLPIRFPDAIGVTGGMILVSDEKDARPELRFEAVLGPDA